MDNTGTDVAEVEALLNALPDTFLACRDMRHAWSVEHDFYVHDRTSLVGGSGKGVKYLPKVLTIARDLACMRCGTIRREVFIQRKWGLEKLSNSYEYVDGYQLRGVPRGTKASTLIHDVQYRKTMNRLAIEASQTDPTASPTFTDPTME